MASLRKRSINDFIALLPDQYNGMHVAPEKLDEGVAEVITVGNPDAADPVRILIKAKIGATPHRSQEAAKQAHRQRHFEPCALAFALCYARQLRN